jgi:hypothetical protein
VAPTKNKTKNLSATSIRKIRRMIAAVLAEPEFYDQETFGRAICKDDGEPACGTVCCAAGWAVWLEDKSTYDHLMKKTLKNPFGVLFGTWKNAAMRSLGLSLGREYDSFALFGYSSDWPEPFATRYEIAKTPKEKAKVFAARWEKFIESDGSI